jgi:prevent-host-death family protein
MECDMVKIVSATEARVHFGDVTRRVEERGEAVVVERDGREVVAIIPIDEYRRFEASQASRKDWWEMMEETRALIRAELGDREITPAEEMIRQIREENDARFPDLP